MFRNTLSGLTKREKEVFDQVCMHLNGLMNKWGLRSLDGEEDQLLIDLWMDTFPYKTDENGNYVYKTVREEVWQTVNGKYTKVVKEKQVRELDFTKTLIESTSVGIYKWRAEQLFINKCKYLFGDHRVRKMNAQGVAETTTVVDAWGNERTRAVYEEEVDPKKVSKRDLSKNINESDLAPEGEDPISIADIAGTVDGGYEEYMFMDALERICDETELKVCKKLLGGDSKNQVYKDFEAEGIKFTARQMENLKAKLLPILKPSYAN